MENFLGLDLGLNILGNTIEIYLQALVVFVGLFLVFGVIQKVVIKRLQKASKKTKTDIDDVLVETISSIRPHVYSFVSFYLGLKFLDLVAWLDKTIDVLLLIIIVYQVVKIFQILTNYIVGKSLKGETGEETKTAARFLSAFVKWILWAFGLLLILQNLGVNVTSLIAGLGIGGLAIAFALQQILADLFSSFAIYLDKPFVIGDFIKVGEYSGTVQKIGIKTTRILSSQGEEIIISNTELTSAKVRNFRKMEKRRVVFDIGVVYELKQDKLERVQSLVKEAVESSGFEFGRTHLKEFGDSGIIFEIVYFVATGDYNEHVATQHKINLKIKELFDKEKIDFAYPTQVQYVKKM